MRRFAVVSLAVLGLLGIFAPPAQARTPGFRLIFSDAFNIPTKLGSFRDCDHNTDTPQAYCGGLDGSVSANWWAYPAGWPDTATEWGYRVGGYYHPEDTVWIAPSAWGDGQMHIRMYRPADGGPVHSATVVPKKAMRLKYGRYEIRERVSHVGVGFKSAQLLWPVGGGGCSEIDFPENSHDVAPSAYDHPADCGPQDWFDTRVAWTAWHTYTITWLPSGVAFGLDGRVIGVSRYSPRTPMDWDIQNESSLDGETARPGSWDQIDISYVRVWSYS
ncbi:glycoside hydrolase family 16 protein [Streptantibioticus rubrisoli]|uniref:Glycoside hydrolase family 16 protein n=1 Tax=Streptantibioticus rubrisoli TaxID=1387313 RepID=A0ABT1P6R9_9ACTN|nr:glycoside hydrolase family 16 protein [Streptantibioticus rubrisoli]MCQ4041078.1 glycoside hydrolase family 16 protein [Streptantibioticus rubrisoli]